LRAAARRPLVEPASVRIHENSPANPTVDLYDWYVDIRGNRVEQLWPITARGALY
jgi:hypothetical protein